MQPILCQVWGLKELAGVTQSPAESDVINMSWHKIRVGLKEGVVSSA